MTRQRSIGSLPGEAPGSFQQPSISHYRLLERLGAGPRGSAVYKALDLKLERLVALKVLPGARELRAEDRRLLTRDAQDTSALEHPNLCSVYEVGETEDGAVFLAMAFCEGGSLAERIARGPLKIEVAVDLALQVAAGLARAHEAGIVHRGLKPSNVLVSADGQARIADFGMGRLDERTRVPGQDEGPEPSAWTSPEQLRGEEADARSDVWALGAILYAMAAGQPPGREPGREPIPLSTLRPDVPAELERIVARALAVRPAGRYPGVEAMRADLRRLVRPPGSRQEELRSAHGAGIGGIGDIGPYRVGEILGRGGMGLVYRAEDTRLGRTVAIKILPPELTRDPVAKARFLQEARAASSLDHPNLCTVYDVGETEARQLYLVMPCYDGETLRQRMDSRGALPVAEAFDYAAQALKGIAKAHRHGIVHRDIKPANLMITGDGVLKILDFGISKLAGAATGLTRTGLAVGTPSYMSPEQTMGHDVDARTDLWALGVVLYEMLAGCRPFTGESEPALQAGVLQREPEPIRRLRPDTPAELEAVLRRLLAKDRDERYASAEAALDDLRVLLGTATRAVPLAVPPAVPLAGLPVPVPRRTLRLWLGAAAALAVLGALAGYWLRSGERGAEAVAASFTRLTDQEGRELFPSLSPDGQYFVYARPSPGGADLYLQRIGGGNPILLTPDTPGDDTQPAFSPDGHQIAFRSEREGGGIFLMGATGESVRRLTKSFGYNPAWSPDGREILVATEGISDPAARLSRSQLWRVDAATGRRRRLVSEGAEEDAVQPSWSPNGRRIAYWGLPAGSGRRVISTVAVSGKERGGAPVRVTDDGFLNWNPVWSPDGRHLYFASDRSGSMNLWRVRIDESSGRLLGEPEPITTPSPWSGLLSLSRDGRRILYVSDTSESNVEAVAFDPEAGRVRGAIRPVTRGARAVRALSVSPDGQWIAFDTAAPREDLFLVRPDGSGLRQLTSDQPKDRLPRWSPSGGEIVFYSNRSGRYEVWTIRPDGSGLSPLTRMTGPFVSNPNWSPDGRWLVCDIEGQGSGLIDLSEPLEKRRPRPLPRVDGRVHFVALSWSSDSRWLAGSLRPLRGSSNPGIHLYSPETGTYRRLTSWGVGALWVPGRSRLLVWEEGRLAVVDTGTGEARDTGAPPPGPYNTPALSFRPDGRELYRVRAVEKSDVWMLDLEDRGGFARLSPSQSKR